MPIGDVAGDVIGSGESGKRGSDNKETGKVHFVKVFWIEKEIGDAQVFAKISGGHGKKDDPGEEHDLIPFQVVGDQLYRKGIIKST